MSQSISFLSRKLDAESANIANYIVNTDLIRLGYGIPLSEYAYTNHSLSVESTELVTGSNTAKEIFNPDYPGVPGEEPGFIQANNDGDNRYLLYKLSGNWSYDTRNKAIFADEGFRVRTGYEASIPGSELEFYKARFEYLHYIKLAENYTFRYSLDLDYGKAYGNTTELPPFERFYAGGSRSVRGYSGNSLGEKDSNGDPVGGDRRVVTNLEMILPNPFSERSQEIRLTGFIDGGYVWAPGTQLDLGDMRYSAGVGLIWITPVGIMRFSLANPLNDKPGDDTTSFQFTLGTDL
jgi:outer membrane protein insertion porin family